MPLLLAIEDSLTGGGIVGGAVTAGWFLYSLWEKRSKRKTEQRKEDNANDAAEIVNGEQQVKFDGMARSALKEAYTDLMRVHKEVHDADVARWRAELADTRTRIAALEDEGKACHETTNRLQKQNDAQAGELAELRAKVADLEGRLHAAAQDLVDPDPTGDYPAAPK